MKKMNLKNLNLETEDILQRNQLKSILGGNGGFASCTANCHGGGTVTCNDSSNTSCATSDGTSQENPGQCTERIGGEDHVTKCGPATITHAPY